MADRKIRAILLSMMVIILASGMIGAIYACPDNGGHYPLFSPVSHGGPNPPGRIDLKIRDQDEGWGDGVQATWTASNMSPGDEFAFNGQFVGLRGNVPGIEIRCDYAVLEESLPVDTDTDPHTNLHPDSMAKYMVITGCIYRNARWQIDCLTGKYNRIPITNTRWRIDDVDHDGRLTFYDLKKDPLLNLPPPDGMNGSTFEMSVCFDRSAGNQFQGDTFNLSMVYRAR
jgi:hypothetical protein